LIFLNFSNYFDNFEAKTPLYCKQVPIKTAKCPQTVLFNQ
jgi:hypothetical protein